MSSVNLNRICKRYHALEVIADLNLSINEGEFMVVVGPSGCGKSTLLRMIAGLETISDGHLHIDAIRVNDLPPQKRNIAMVFQTYALFPHMTVRKNIEFGPRVRREKGAEMEKKISRAAKVLNISQYMDRLPSELSGGQRQRVAMGRAIVRDSKLFLFDEPLSNLDAHLRAEMRTEIKSLHQKLGATIVYVTHDQIEAMTMADRIVIMNKGRIEQIGTPTDLYDFPVNIFVAGFLGSPSMSFIPSTISGTGDNQSLKLDDGSVLPVSGVNYSSTEIILGVRPESYDIDPNGTLAMNVDVVEPTGAEVMAYGYIAGQSVRCVFRGRPQIDVGGVLRLGVKRKNMHFFDRASGMRL
ncbi:ABC transporter ATP-binding protein [Maritalea myrionectae]|nr:sn-glycerol-3-phosphate ABC transporter ATP-binding protein UgpC [Maritalea myrionectae]